MIGTKLKIKCVLEGFEENTLFELVEKYGVSDKIELAYKNAEGGGNVGAYFYDYYSSGDYDLVLCVYDVDYSKDDSKKMYLRIYNDLLEMIIYESYFIKSIFAPLCNQYLIENKYYVEEEFYEVFDKIYSLLKDDNNISVMKNTASLAFDFGLVYFKKYN